MAGCAGCGLLSQAAVPRARFVARPTPRIARGQAEPESPDHTIVSGELPMTARRPPAPARGAARADRSLARLSRGLLRAPARVDPAPAALRVSRGARGPEP